MQNKNPMLQLSTISNILPPTFYELYIYNLFRIMLLFSFFMFCGNQLILCHHTHLSSFIHIKILNHYKDFHFLPRYYKKEKRGEERYTSKTCCNSTMEISITKIFPLLSTSSFRFCWIKVFMANNCYFSDDVSVCNQQLFKDHKYYQNTFESSYNQDINFMELIMWW